MSVLYGMSFRHPKAWQLMNNFAARHVDKEVALHTLFIWQRFLNTVGNALGPSFSEYSRAVKQKIVAELTSSEEYRKILPEFKKFIGTPLMHDADLLVAFKDASTSSGFLGKPGALNVSLSECLSLRPFGDTPMDKIRELYNSTW